MLEILLLMALGMAIGYFLRGKDKTVARIEKSILWSIYLLLFFLGLSIGGNKLILSNLPSLGLNALIITLGGVAGSILMAWAFWRLFFIRERRKE